MDTNFEVLSFYFFISLDAPAISALRSDFELFVDSIGLRGLIIVAPEGLNGTVACPNGKLEQFTSYLRNNISEGDWKFKFSVSETAPFKRFSFKVRDEIVTSGFPDLIPDTKDPSHISPEQWHSILEKEKDYFLIDVRNDYEVKLGKFKGAINPETKDFKEFPEFIDSCDIPRDKPVYICCTGGIRCEKAYLEMKQKGFKEVYQLDGGILSYIEQYPDGYYEGECFVFDDRVALDKNLSPSKKYSLCPHCGDPASEFVSCSHCGKEKKICEKCQKYPEKKTCSKNCAYHHGLHLGKIVERKSEINDVPLLSESGRSVLAVLVLIFLFMLLPFFAYAASNPEDVAREAIGKMQKKGDPSPVVEYVDWDHMFQTLAANNKKVMNVSTPSELKSFYKKVLESPSSEISDLLMEKLNSEELGGGAEIDQSKAVEVIAKLKERLQEKETQMKTKLQDSEYTIEKISEDENSALVKISQTFKSETRTDQIQMHKKNGSWYFTSLSNAFMQKQ